MAARASATTRLRALPPSWDASSDNLQRRRAVGLQLLAFLETDGWTEAHLDGSANPATVPRPDLALYLGVHHDVQMTIECKRLLDPSANARGYVVDRLCRFLDGRYQPTRAAPR